MRLLCKASFSPLFVYDLLQLHALSPYLFLFDFGADLCVEAVCLMGGGGLRSRKLLHGVSVYSLPRVLSIGC